MPERLTVIEQILRAIATRLALITVAAGKSVTVSEVYRPLATGSDWHPKPDSITLVVSRERPAEVDHRENAGPYYLEYWWQPVDAICLPATSDTSATAIDTLLSNFAGEVEEAILSDVHWTTGSVALACDTRKDGREVLDAGKGCDAIAVQFSVKYRVKDTDPFTIV